MERLRHRKDFVAAARGQRVSSQAFSLQVSRREGQPDSRFGLTVSRKVGTAVERNRAKRRMREAVRRIPTEIAEQSVDYVIVARRAVLSLRFAQLCHEVFSALKRARRAKGSGAVRRANAGEVPAAQHAPTTHSPRS